MLWIEGQKEGPEYEAAETLHSLFATAWPWLVNDPENDVVLVVGVQCHGQTPRDLDVVLLARLPARPQFQPRFQPDRNAGEHLPTPVVRVESLCVVFEVKDHDPRGIKIRGTEVEVAYTKPNGRVEWKNASQQSEQQKYSLKNYLEAHVDCSPWVVNLVWLRGVEGRDLPRGTSNILPSKFTLNGLLNRCLREFYNLPYHGVLDWRLGLEMAKLASEGNGNVDLVSNWGSFENPWLRLYHGPTKPISASLEQLGFVDAGLIGGLPAYVSEHRRQLRLLVHPLWADSHPDIIVARTTVTQSHPGYNVKLMNPFHALRRVIDYL